MESFFDSLGDVKTINVTNRDLCDAPITVTDFENAIGKLKLNKSPGNDGLTTELYRLFPQDLAKFLQKVYIESINNEELPSSLAQGLITLIPKPQKDPTLLDNWRPITLLNNDYNIIAICLNFG